MKAGIIGLPNVGKSTLFNLLAHASVPAANYPFCTISPNVGAVSVHDARLDRLAAMIRPEKVTPAAVEFVDVAGLVKGASLGEGKGNEFLSAVRAMDVLIHVVRSFPGDDVVHATGGVDPLVDALIVEEELALSDIQILGRRIEKLGKEVRHDKEAAGRLAAAEALLETLNRRGEDGFRPDADQGEEARGFDLIAWMPMLYLVNCAEEQIADGLSRLAGLSAHASLSGRDILAMAVKFEQELEQLPAGEQEMFRAEYGITEGAVDRLIGRVYRMLGLVTFFTTAGGREVRATAVPAGTAVRSAAGRIHSDMEAKFIRAEVYNFQDLDKYGSEKEVRARGLLRVEGRDYAVQDGDIVLIKF